MRATITIDADTLEEVVRITRSRTKSAAIRAALSEFIRQHRKAQLLAMRGHLELDDSWAEFRDADAAERDP